MNPYRSENFAKAFYDKGELPLAYRAGMTCEQRAAWRRALKEKVTELMAFPDSMYEEPVVEHLLSKDRGCYTVEKYAISPEPDLWMTFLLLKPKGASAEHKTSAVLCTPGTGWTKECLAGEEFWDLAYEPSQPPTGLNHRYYYANAMAQHYAMHGITAVACEDLGVGEHGGTLAPRDIERLLLGQGRSMMGVTVEVRLALLKWLKTCPWVDVKRLAVSGHSLGVDSAMHVAILDEDVTVFVYNDFICDWKQRISHICPPEPVPVSDWHMYPGIYRYYSYPDLLAAYAPRKLFITEGGRTAELEKLRGVYEELGAGACFRYDYYPDYADAANRMHDGEPLKKGMTGMEFLDYSNVVAEKHFFKFETAVPWLASAWDKSGL